ncbi:Ubiquitin fusion degradation protein 4, partial [Cryomyces antarcticus]
MLSNLDIDILEEALRSVAYASYLASILSQQENATLVTFALQAAELLLKRLEPVYRHQFYREGVISEIAKLANRPIAVVEEDKKSHKPAAKSDVPDPYTMGTSSSAGDSDNNEEPDDVEDNGAESEDEDHDDDHNESDGSSSSSERHCPPPPPLSSVQDIITMRAK